MMTEVVLTNRITSKEEIIDNAASSGITEYIRDRLVAVADGTGNLLNVGVRNFIVTCKHIAEPFFQIRRPYVVLRGNIRLPIDRLRIAALTNDDIDIALIEIDGAVQSRGTYSLADIEVVPDFSTHSWNLTNLVISGLPSDLAVRDQRGDIHHSWLSYMTSPHRGMRHSEDFVYADYQMNKELMDQNSNETVRLPAALGLSGSFILKMRQFEGSKSQMWLPRFTKVIAVQQSWDEKTFVKGSNAKYVLSLLKEVKAI